MKFKKNHSCVLFDIVQQGLRHSLLCHIWMTIEASRKPQFKIMNHVPSDYHFFCLLVGFFSVFVLFCSLLLFVSFLFIYLN